MHQFHKFILSWNSTCFRQFDRSCSKAVYKPVWHIPFMSVQWINSWWWTDELSETCRVLSQNKFVKLVHLVGFITKKDLKLSSKIVVIYGIFFFCLVRKNKRKIVPCLTPWRHTGGAEVRLTCRLVSGDERSETPRADLLPQNGLPGILSQWRRRTEY